MKLVKSSFAKKLIIVLIALMIFNIAVPQEAKAWDIAGILFKPISSLILSVLVSIDVTIGLTLCGLAPAVNTIGSIIDALVKDERCKNSRWYGDSPSTNIYWTRYNFFWKSYNA